MVSFSKRMDNYVTRVDGNQFKWTITSSEWTESQVEWTITQVEWTMKVGQINLKFLKTQKIIPAYQQGCCKNTFSTIKTASNYPRFAPRPPRFVSVARFKVVKRSSLSFKKRAIFCSKFSLNGRSRSFGRLFGRGR